MKFGILMDAFKEYLKSTNTEIKYSNSSSKVKAGDDNTNISIFSHQKEFKKFLSKEFDTDLNLNTMSLSDIMALDFSNGKINNPFADKEDDTSEATEQDELENEDNALILDVLNNILEDESVIKIADLDGDGVISDEEKNTLLGKMSSLDGNDEDLSMDDIFDAMNDKNVLNVASKTQKEASKASSGAPSSGSSGGSSGSSSLGGSSNKTTSTDTTEKNVESMSLKELNAELDTANGTLSERQEALNQAASADNPNLSGLKDNIDNQYEAYREQVSLVDEKLAEQLDDITTRLDAKEQKIQENTTAIANQTVVVQNAQNTYTAAQNTTKGLRDKKSTLEGQLSGAEESQKEAIREMISGIDEAIATAEENERQAKETLDTEQENLKTLEDEKTTLEGELEQIQQEKNTFEEEYINSNDELRTLKENWEEAKVDYQSAQETEIQNATEALNETQEYINKLNSAISAKELEEQTKQYSLDPKDEYNSEIGNKLADAAHNVQGTTGLCLAGTWRSINSAFGFNKDIPDGYGSAYLAADILRGNVAGYEEYGEHFKEVSGLSTEDLKSLPAGAIVVWDANKGQVGQYGHISIALGDGNESSDHIQAQAQWDGEFTVFYPV